MRASSLASVALALVVSAAAAGRWPFADHRGLYGVTVPLAAPVAPEAVAEAARSCGASAVMIRAGWHELEPKPHLYDWSALDALAGALAKADLPVALSVWGTPEWASEPTPAELELFDARGWGALARALPPREEHLDAFATFYSVLTRRYRGTVSGYEILPEPDGAGLAGILRDRRGVPVDVSFEPRPALYAELLRTAATRIKEMDPDALVISGGLTDTGSSDFLKSLVELGALKDVDLVGVQLWNMPPGRDWTRSYASYYATDWHWLEEAREQLLAAGLGAKPVCVTAWGYAAGVHELHGVPASEHADAVVWHLSQMSQHPYVTHAFYCALLDTDAPTGLYDEALTPREAAARFGALARAPAVYMSVSMPEIFDDLPARGEILVANETEGAVTLDPESELAVEGPEGLIVSFGEAVTIDAHGLASLPFSVLARRPDVSGDGTSAPRTATFRMFLEGAERSVTVDLPRPTKALAALVEPARAIVQAGETALFSVALENRSGTALAVSARMDGAEERPPGVRVAPGALATLTVATPTPAVAPPQTRETAVVVEYEAVGGSGAEGVKLTQRLPAVLSVLCRIPRMEEPPAIDGVLDEWRGLPWWDAQPEEGGPLARVRLAWSERGLYAAVRVADETHYQPFADHQLWKADSVQLAVDQLLDAVVGREGYDDDDLEMGFALGPGGAFGYRFVPAPGLATGPMSTPVAVRREARATTYEIALPREALPQVHLREGTRLGLSVLVNASDSPGDRRTSQWGGGIASGKFPALAIACELGPSPARAIPERRLYLAPRLTGPIVVDGEPDEAWRQVPWTEEFTMLGYLGEGPPTSRTRAKLAWDGEALYVLAWMEDPDIEATYTAHDSALWEEEVFEVFIDPPGTGENYFELQVNPLGTTTDLRIIEPSFEPWQRAARWECAGWTHAAKVFGTVGDPSDTDTAWTVEMRIPFKALGGTPRPGDTWRLQMYRFDRGAGREREEGVAWSPSVATHVTEEFGEVMFAAHPQEEER